MNICRTCLIPDTRPDTHFVDGKCSACRSHANRPSIDWPARREELLQLLDRHNGSCIVPSSGGKDSTAQALTMMELGADVTVVTATTCHLTEIGRKNIDNLARFARTIEVSPNKTVRAKLNRLGLTMVGDISWPEHVSIFRTPFKMALALDIPLIMYGENPLNQYGSPPGMDEARTMTQRWVSEFGGFLGLRPQDLIGTEGLTERDMWAYMGPNDKDLQQKGIEAHFLGQYMPWDSHANADKAMVNGMLAELPSPACWWPWENLDNAQTGIHDWFGYLKYGYGRAAAQLSVDIRDGRITRDMAQMMLGVREGLFPIEYAGVHIDEVLDRIGMTRDNFLGTAKAYTNRTLFDNTFEWGEKPMRRGIGMGGKRGGNA